MVHEVVIFGLKEEEEMEFKCKSATKLPVKTTPPKSVYIQYIIFPISADDMIHSMGYIIQTGYILFTYQYSNNTRDFSH